MLKININMANFDVYLYLLTLKKQHTKRFFYLLKKIINLCVIVMIILVFASYLSQNHHQDQVKTQRWLDAVLEKKATNILILNDLAFFF